VLLLSGDYIRINVGTFIEKGDLFTQENSDMKVHKNYTYINCMLECALAYTRDEVYRKHGVSCQPWFIPVTDRDITICDPWLSYEFYMTMTNNIPDNQCQVCLPDCSITLYEPTVNIMPLGVCDITNVGINQFCSFNKKRPNPLTSKFTTQVRSKFDGMSRIPDYVLSLESGMRVHAQTLQNGDIFQASINDTTS